MTGRLLAAVAEAHGPLLVRGVLALVAILLLPLTLSVDVVAAATRGLRRRAALAAKLARCPRGHAVALHQGAWECGTCHLPSDGHAWSACEHCGERAHAIRCPCGAVVVNPLSPVGER